MENQFAVGSHSAYLFLSVLMTIWVAKTLFKNGRVFLVDAMHGNEKLADSINHLLVVGFYLINVGYIAMALKEGRHPGTLVESIESVSSKVGVVLLILGAMHFLNLALIAYARKQSIETAQRNERLAQVAKLRPMVEVTRGEESVDFVHTMAVGPA